MGALTMVRPHEVVEPESLLILVCILLIIRGLWLLKNLPNEKQGVEKRVKIDPPRGGNK